MGIRDELRLEKDVDSSIQRHAHKRGIISIKLTTFGMKGEAGWPDRLFLRGGKVVFMELKRKGKTSSDNQINHQNRLAAEGFIVYKDIDDPNVGKAILDKEFP